MRRGENVLLIPNPRPPHRLWYQLGEEINNALKSKEYEFAKQSGGMKSIYDNLIVDLEQRISPYRVAMFAKMTVKEINDVDAGLAFVSRVLTKITSDFGAKILLNTCSAELLLNAKRMREAKEKLEEVKALTEENLDITEAHGYYYYVSSEYYRFEGTHSEYFREALKFLGVVKLDDLSFEERRNIAGRLAVAAIVSDDIFSFGEILVHPIVAALKTPHDQWLYNLLNYIHRGDGASVAELKPKWSKGVPELMANEENIVQKTKLMALIEMSYQRKPDNRQLKFEDIMQQTGVKEEEVGNTENSSEISSPPAGRIPPDESHGVRTRARRNQPSRRLF